MSVCFCAKHSKRIKGANYDLHLELKKHAKGTRGVREKERKAETKKKKEKEEREKLSAVIKKVKQN